MSDDPYRDQKMREYSEQELSAERASLPFIGEKVELHGNTYECVNVDWDRRDDEITAVYRNVDKEDPDYSQYTGHFLSNPADVLKGGQTVEGRPPIEDIYSEGVSPKRNVINVDPDHPSARYQTESYPNPAGPDRFA